ASLGIVRTGMDPQQGADAANRQAAADINRKAAALLDSFEVRLGVRIADIRSKPQLSEPDLDLLLQVNDFAKAATWYAQASTAGRNGDIAFGNFGRILLRSARRVEQGMETATLDRRFGDAWASIQDNLRQIRPDGSVFNR